MEAKMNPYAMNMIVKQQQGEARRMAALYRRMEESEGDSRKGAKGKSVMAWMSLLVTASVLGLSILV
jgi:hypothetical protein